MNKEHLIFKRNLADLLRVERCQILQNVQISKKSAKREKIGFDRARTSLPKFLNISGSQMALSGGTFPLSICITASAAARFHFPFVVPQKRRKKRDLPPPDIFPLSRSTFLVILLFLLQLEVRFLLFFHLCSLVFCSCLQTSQIIFFSGPSLWWRDLVPIHSVEFGFSFS